jgi:hypothetical protein
VTEGRLRSHRLGAGSAGPLPGCVHALEDRWASWQDPVCCLGPHWRLCGVRQIQLGRLARLDEATLAALTNRGTP